MSFPPDEIATERLLLRHPRMEDAEVVFELYATDVDVVRYVAWPPHASLEVTRGFFSTIVDNWSRGEGHRPWVLERKDDGQLLGMLGVDVDGRGANMGYVIARPFWNLGYVSEAVRVVVDTALAEPKIYRAWAICDVDNAASARVMEKAGMEYEGRLRRYGIHPNVSPEPRDVLVYARVR